MKCEPGELERTEALYLDLTRPHFGADIVVWPEVGRSAESSLREFLAGVRAEAQAAGSSLIIGLVRRSGHR
jgi:apolipoprotein N-acyltransferase